MVRTFEMRTPIDSRDIDGLGHCRASALMGHLQEAATQAAEVGGFTRQLLLERYGAFWMLTRAWVKLDRPLKWEEELTIRTWHRGTGHGAVLYRDFDLFVGEEPVGEAVTAWVLADLNTRRLLRLKTIAELEDTQGADCCKDVLLRKLHCPQELTLVEHRPMRYSDTDINGHVNNTRYADFACDAAALDKLPRHRFLSEFQLGYLAECRPGEVIAMETGDVEKGKYVRGLDETGKPCFEAALIFGEVVS